MSTFLDRILIACALVAMVQCSIQADPTGTKTVTDCVPESALPDLLAPGERT